MVHPPAHEGPLYTTVAWPYVPLREGPDRYSRMRGADKHGQLVEFDASQPRGPVTPESIAQGGYLKCWLLTEDGKRGREGWVMACSEHGIHFTPKGEQPLGPDAPSQPEVTERFRETYDAEALLRDRLARLPRRTSTRRSTPPPEAASRWLLGAGAGMAQSTPCRSVLLACLPWGHLSSSTTPVVKWLQRLFDVPVTRMRRQSLEDLVAGTFRHSDDELLIVLVQEPWSWAACVEAQGAWGMLTPAKPRADGAPDQFEYCDKSNVAYNLEHLLHSALICRDAIYPEGLMGIWSAYVDGAIGSIGAQRKNGVLLRLEDFIFSASSIAESLTRLGLPCQRVCGNREMAASSDPLAGLRRQSDLHACVTPDAGQDHLLTALMGYVSNLEAIQAMRMGDCLDCPGVLSDWLGYGGHGDSPHWVVASRRELETMDLSKLSMHAEMQPCNRLAVTWRMGDAATNAANISATLRRHGVVWVRGVFTRKVLEAVRGSWMDLLSQPHSCSLEYGHLRDGRVNRHLPFEQPFDAIELLGASGIFAPVLTDLLGSDFDLESVTVISTPPGSRPQRTHRDIQCEGCIAVHVPLELLSEAFAPLAVCGGTHLLPDESVELLSEELPHNEDGSPPSPEQADAFEAAFRKRLCTAQHPGSEPIIGSPIDVGDAILYDARVWHGGMANHESRDRHVLYLNFRTASVLRERCFTNDGNDVGAVGAARQRFCQRLRECMASTP